MKGNKIPILMYHSIEKMPKETVMRSLHVSPKAFAIQMSILNTLGYKGLSLNNLRPYLEGKRQGKVVGITFDDGYKNNLLNATPILNKYNFSATCFIVSDFIGLSNVWDIDKGITQRPLMSEGEIYDWINCGMEIGAHTKSHPDLTKSSKEEIYKEISECKIILEQKFNQPIMDFCYPYGKFDDLSLDLVNKSGYLSASSMIRGKASFESNRFLLPRIPINYRTLPHMFLIKILTNYEDRRKIV